MPRLPDLLQTAGSFLLTGHENPDGDCVGAQCALYHLLTALGKQAYIVNPDPIGRSFDFLTGHTPFASARHSEPLPDFEVGVLLDCAQLSRVGSLGERIGKQAGTVAVIDHHVGSEDGDGSVFYVDSTAAATGALVHRLYKELDVEMTLPAAEGVFLSLVSDTGWFRYSNANTEVFAMASELIALGVDGSRIYDLLHRRNHVDSPAVLADALGRRRMLLNGRLAIVSLDKAMIERCSRIDFDTDAVMDPLRSIEGIEVVALLKERFDGSVKCSLRAKGDVDVQAIVKAFGGGGHKKAAGATLSMSLADAQSSIELAVQQALAADAASDRQPS